MNTDMNGNIKLSSIVRKDIYTDEEKKIIMDRLDEERRIHQNAEASLDSNSKQYDEEEKKKILQRLNEKRVTTQKHEEINKARIYKKQIYKFGSKEFYKFQNMEREYFIEIADIKKLSSRAVIIPLYYRVFEELKKKEILIKTEVYSEKIFISYNPIRVYFKGYSLEDEYR
ncbi:hypothetical protein [Sulfurovum sp.]|uniref:hypothetical protein n=1 Tax=Sulfurovum sp. TaxID=1969726 RepID=UPI002867F36A|nr:hypothetical protein [Sulfurovum sp.]